MAKLAKTDITMTALKEGRMIAAHMIGRRDYDEKRPMIAPAYLTDKDEIDSYRAGYLGNARRAANGGL